MTRIIAALAVALALSTAASANPVNGDSSSASPTGTQPLEGPTDGR